MRWRWLACCPPTSPRARRPDRTSMRARRRHSRSARPTCSRAARRALRASPPLGEASYTELESAANRYLELAQARAPGATLRLARGPLLPARSALRSLPDGPEPAAEQRAAALANADARVAAYES